MSIIKTITLSGALAQTAAASATPIKSNPSDAANILPLYHGSYAISSPTGTTTSAPLKLQTYTVGDSVITLQAIETAKTLTALPRRSSPATPEYLALGRDESTITVPWSEEDRNLTSQQAYATSTHTSTSDIPESTPDTQKPAETAAASPTLETATIDVTDKDVTAYGSLGAMGDYFSPKNAHLHPGPDGESPPDSGALAARWEIDYITFPLPWEELPRCYQHCVEKNRHNGWAGGPGDYLMLSKHEFCHSKWFWVGHWILEAVGDCVYHECGFCRPQCEEDSNRWMDGVCGPHQWDS